MIFTFRFLASLREEWRARRRTRLASVSVLAVFSLAGCSTYNSLTQRIAQHLTPYHVTIVQGNFVSAEAVAKLRVGMTPEEVRAALGMPLLTDMFHRDRWDYVFYFKRGSTEVVQERDLTVHFADGHLASWSGGDDLPSEYELISEIDGDRHAFSRHRQAERARVTSEAEASAAEASAAEASAAVPTVANAAAPGDGSGALPANVEAARAANRAVAADTGGGNIPRGGSPALTRSPVPGLSLQSTPTATTPAQPQFRLSTQTSRPVNSAGAPRLSFTPTPSAQQAPEGSANSGGALAPTH